MGWTREIISWEKTELRSMGRYSGRRRESIRMPFDGGCLDRFVGTDTTEPVQPDGVSALRSGQKPGAHPAR